MTIEQWGSIGELLAAIATIVTLIYLAIQIKQGAKATTANIRQSLTDNQIHYINLRATDPVLRSAVTKMFQRQDPTEDETAALRMHATAGMRLFEGYFAQYRMKTLGEEEWRVIRVVMKGHLYYEPYREAFLVLETAWHTEFAQEVREIIDEIDNRT